MSLSYTESIVHLKAPIISENTILKYITCTRPKRHDGVNITIEQINQKQVIHCYGHAGFGWSTLFDSINHAIELFENHAIDLNKPICVIGSGCMGLTAAIELAHRGYTISKIITKDLYDLPSWRAPGCFALDSATMVGPEKENHKKMVFETFKSYKSIDSGMHPYLKPGAVRFLPIYCMDGMYGGFEGLEKEGLIPQRETVTLDLSNGIQHKNFIKFMTYFMDTAKLMQQLHDEVVRLGIAIEIKNISSFDDVQEDIIFNCTGMGGKELNNDTSMVPTRGHLIVLNEHAGNEHMDYMLYAKVEQNGQQEIVLIFPKSLAVSSDYPQGVSCCATLGGTYLPIDNAMTTQELEELDKREFKKLTDRLSLFFTGNPFVHSQ
jgi:hypothetical protein